jgi:hypothetical protein
MNESPFISPNYIKLNPCHKLSFSKMLSVYINSFYKYISEDIIKIFLWSNMVAHACNPS